MARDQEIIEYLLRLEDNMSDGMQLTAQRADELEDALEDLRKVNQEGEQGDKNRRTSMSQLARGFGLAAKAALAAGAALGTMGGFAIKTSANLEAFEVRLGGLLGGLDEGKQRVRELFELSARTPFSIQGLVEADATLEAFGVNAPRVRQGVLDLAGALGIEVTEAAGAVGKALAGGAGAADILREKGILTAVEMQAGMAVTEMTTDQFREALVRTLETNEKLAGGTTKLATTFSGLFSTMRDQFTVFSKQVGDADLFATAKATLVVMLDLIDRNKEAVGDFAATIGSGLAKSIVFVIDSFFRFLALIQQARAGFLIMNKFARQLGVTLVESAISAMEGLGRIPLIGDAIRDGLGGAIQDSKLIVDEMNRGIDATEEKIGAALDKQDALREEGARVVHEIEELARAYQKAADAAGDVKTEDSDAIMTMVGVDQKAKKQAEATAKALDTFGRKLESMRDKFRGAAMQVDKTTTLSEKLQFRLDKMAHQFAEAQQKAAELGPEAVARFDQIKGGMIASMNAIAAAIPQAQRQEQMAAIGDAAGAAVDFLSSGGTSALAGAGPIGAAAAGAIQLGQQGDAAFDSAVSDLARQLAQDRQRELQQQRQAMEAKGATEAEMAAAGLTQSEIQAAGQVTEEDLAAAEAQTDRGEVMADIVTQSVQSVIDGIRSIIDGLPQILSELIPMLLIELPEAIIESFPELVEELIPVIITELPKALFMMSLRLIPRLLRMLFIDLPSSIYNGMIDWWKSVWGAIKEFFSFGFATGGYVPRTGLALVHQGERVIPANGAGTGTATAGLQAFMGGGGTNVTINTNVVDPDSIPALGRMLERDLGAHGRVENDLFGRPDPFNSI